MNALRQNTYVKPREGETVTIVARGCLWGWATGSGRIASFGSPHRGIEIDLPHTACPPGWRHDADERGLVRVRIDWDDAGKLVPA